MGDTLKLYKGKRHKSSSSLSSFVIEGTKSERKFGLKGSIPEVEDKFGIAEARCNDLKEKIEMVKAFKRKRKLKKRSITRVFPDNLSDCDEIPFMKIHTKPKKKLSQRSARLRGSANPARSCVESAITDQHRMADNRTDIFDVNFQQRMREAFSQTKVKRKSDDNYIQSNKNPQITNLEVINKPNLVTKRKPLKKHLETITRVSVETNNDENIIHVKPDDKQFVQFNEKSVHRKNKTRKPIVAQPKLEQIKATRPEVELLFNKEIISDEKISPTRRNQQHDDLKTESSLKGDIYLNDKKSSKTEQLPKARFRCRRYELPTISSRMKQAGMRYYQASTNYTNIPFIASKSITPSHNIGVNIQQVLYGMKIQQPLSGIPLTMAHHMGLRHIPKMNNSKTTSMAPSLDIHEVNAIKVGKSYLMLPTNKYLISYQRLLNMYRQGDGMVPRFLRAISKPHYFYTSMYNLNANRGDFDEATSKARYSQEVRQSLAEYVALYREYENISKKIKQGEEDLQMETRRNDIAKELAAREPNIRQVMQEYKISAGHDSLRASASLAEEEYRHLNYIGSEN